jgi:hypothetical protein
MPSVAPIVAAWRALAGQRIGDVAVADRAPDASQAGEHQQDSGNDDEMHQHLLAPGDHLAHAKVIVTGRDRTPPTLTHTAAALHHVAVHHSTFAPLERFVFELRGMVQLGVR